MARALALFGDSLQARARDGAAAWQEQLAQFGKPARAAARHHRAAPAEPPADQRGKLEPAARSAKRLSQIHRDNAELSRCARPSTSACSTSTALLGESSSTGVERLEQVRGLGEMQVLAAGVGRSQRRSDQRQIARRRLGRRSSWKRCSKQMLSPEAVQSATAKKTREGPSAPGRRVRPIRLPGKPGRGHSTSSGLPDRRPVPARGFWRLVDASHECDRDLVEARGGASRFRESARPPVATRRTSRPST